MVLGGRAQVQRKRVHRSGKLLTEQLMHHTVPLDTVLTLEGSGHDGGVKMTFTGSRRTRVSGMLMRNIFENHSAWRKGLAHFLLHSLLNRHPTPFCDN